jgi:hypothetical protein
MEHSFIEQTDVIDRYVRGTMPPAERFEFEEHFLDCQECLEQLEIARSLREGIKVCAAQPSGAAAIRPRASSWFSWRPAAVGAMAILLFSAIPSVVLYRSLNGALERETSKANQLANASLLPPAVYTLSPTRGAQAARVIGIPELPRWILLALEMDTSQYHDYRAVLQDGTGQAVWTSDALKADSPDAIGVALPSRILHPGDFVLVVEGRRADGRYDSVTSFPLRAAGLGR